MGLQIDILEPTKLILSGMTPSNVRSTSSGHRHSLTAPDGALSFSLRSPHPPRHLPVGQDFQNKLRSRPATFPVATMKLRPERFKNAKVITRGKHGGGAEGGWGMSGDGRRLDLG